MYQVLTIFSYKSASYNNKNTLIIDKFTSWQIPPTIALGNNHLV